MRLSSQHHTTKLPENAIADNYQRLNRFDKNFDGTIFTLGNFEDMIRVQIGQQDPQELRPCRRYALRPQNQPLLEDGIWNDGSIPPLAYSHFRWCGVMSKITSLNNLYHIEGFLPENKQSHLDRLFFIDLLFDEEVYVVDINAGKKYFAGLSGHYRHLRNDLLESYRVTARTIMPIRYYHGEFAEPTVLVGRELLFHEVKYIKSFVRKLMPPGSKPQGVF